MRKTLATLATLPILLTAAPGAAFATSSSSTYSTHPAAASWRPLTPAERAHIRQISNRTRLADRAHVIRIQRTITNR